MNNNRSVNSLFDFLLLSKSFNFTVKLPLQECLARVYDLSQPQTGFLNPVGRTIKIIQEANHARFEVCVECYQRGFVYNSAKASGSIQSLNDDTETTIVSGTIRPGIMFLVLTGSFLVGLFLIKINDLTSNFGFILLVFAIWLLYIVRDFRDYHKLDTLIHDTFSDKEK
jgi:hypothetical protein